MTLLDRLRQLVKRWPVLLVGLLVSAGVALLAIRDPGAYFTRMQVVFLAPSTWYRNVLETTPETVIVAASAVSKRVVGASAVIKYGSLDATIVGTSSVRDGVWIRPEDQGGQWAPDIRAPVILVDVVAATPERVRELQYDTISRIQSELDKLQDELRPGVRDGITIQVAPDATTIYRIRGDRPRALAMTITLGGFATLTMVWVVEAWSTRRRSRSRAMKDVAAGSG